MLKRVASILAIVAMANHDTIRMIKETLAFIPATTTTIQQLRQQQQQRHSCQAKVVKSSSSSSSSFALYYHPEQPPPYTTGNNNSPMINSNEYYDLDLEMATQDVSRAYERGVECANNFGLCDIEEVLDLSEELDEYLDCYVGNSPQDCQAEVDDRQDLAEALLVQAEMREDQEQQSYMQGGEGGYPSMNGGGGGGRGLVENGNNEVNDSLPRTSVWRNGNEQFGWGDDSSMGV